MVSKVSLSIFYFFIAILLSSTFGFSQSPKNGKKIQAITKIYEKGAYKASYRKAKKLNNKIIINIQSNDLEKAQIAALTALSAEAMNQYENLSPLIYQAIQLLPASVPSDTMTYLQTIYFISKTLYNAGLYAQGLQLLDSISYDLISNSTSYTTVYINLVQVHIHTLLKLGYYNRASQATESTYKKLNSILFTESKKSKKQAKKDVALQAKLKFLQATILNEKGAYKNLDSILLTDMHWVRKQIGVRNMVYRDYLNMAGDRSYQKMEWRKATNYYLKAAKYTKFAKIEKTGVDIQDKLALLYYQRGKLHEGLKIRVKFERAARQYYSKRDLHYVRYKLQEIDQLVYEGKYDKADKKLEAAYAIAKFYPANHSIRERMLQKSIWIATRKSQLDRAADSITTLLQIANIKYANHTPAYANYEMQQAYFLAKNTDKIKLAEQVQDQKFKPLLASEIHVENPKLYEWYIQSAYTKEILDKYQESLAMLQEAEKYIVKSYGVKDKNLAVNLEKQAVVLLKKGELAQAETALKRAVEIYKEYSDKVTAQDKANVYIVLSKLYITLGLYDDAEKALNYAAKLNKRSIKSKYDKVKSTDELAVLYINEGRYKDAEEILKNSIFIKTKKLGATSRELIEPYNLLGQVYIVLGNYSEADKHIRKALDLTEKNFTQKSIRYVDVLRTLGSMYKDLGDFKKAIEVENQILNTQYAVLGESHIDIAPTLTRAALLQLYSRGDLRLAEMNLMKAKKIIETNIGTKSPAYADQLIQLANFYIETKRFKSADSCLIISKQIWENTLGAKNIKIAEIYFLKGSIAALTLDFKNSIHHYTKSRDIYKGVLSANHPSYVKATSKLARVYYMMKDYKESYKYLKEATDKYLTFTKKYFPSLSFSEKSKYWNQIKEDFEFYYSVVFSLKDNGVKLYSDLYNNQLATKALLLSSSIKVKERILNSGDPTLISKYNEWTTKKQLLINTISMTRADQVSAGLDPQKLEKEIEILEKDLSESSELFASEIENKSITWKDIQLALGKDHYALEIVRFRHYDKGFTDSVVYVGMIISKNKKNGPEVVVLPEGKKLEKRNLKYYKNVIISKLDEDNLSYEAYWAPFKSKIKDNSKIYASVDGVYNEINLESLQDSNKTFAIDRNEFVFVSNTKDIVTAKNEKKDSRNHRLIRKAVLVGNPLFYADGATVNRGFDDQRAIVKSFSNVGAAETLIKQLPGTEIEINEINKLFSAYNWNTLKFSDHLADEDTLKKLNNPYVLHIATHGYFAPDLQYEGESGLTSTETDFAVNPLLRSGLLLKGAGDILKSNNILKINSEGGVLTAYEAMDLSLDNTALVVLSACETGKGEVQIGEGVYGLQRSILVAGADNLVMTLFKVDDEVTKELMIIFYKNWLESGNMRASFIRAKKVIKDKYIYPVYWGAFVLVGMD